MGLKSEKLKASAKDGGKRAKVSEKAVGKASAKASADALPSDWRNEWRSVRRKLLMQYREMFSKYGWKQSKSNLDVLLYLHMVKDREAPSVIADYLFMSRQTMTSIVDALVRNGYVSCEPDPTDRRSKLVMIEDRGRKAVMDLVKLLRSRESVAVRKVGVDRFMLMLGIMRDFCDALEEDMRSEGAVAGRRAAGKGLK